MPNSRNKGKRYENEVRAELEANGMEAERNLSQTRDGGWDVTTPLFGIECKRAERESWGPWIAQARKSVEGTDKRWAIAHRKSREKTQFLVPMDIMEFCVFSAVLKHLQEGK